MSKYLVDGELLKRIDRIMLAEGMAPDEELRTILAQPAADSWLEVGNE